MEISPVVGRLLRRNWWILGGLILSSILVFPPKVTAGVAVGGGLSVAGFRTLLAVLRRLLILPSHRAKTKIMVYHYLRLLLLFGLLAAILSSRLVDPVALLVGLSVVVINLLWTTLFDARRIKLEV
jgi:hypothetical protein